MPVRLVSLALMGVPLLQVTYTPPRLLVEIGMVQCGYGTCGTQTVPLRRCARSPPSEEYAFIPCMTLQIPCFPGQRVTQVVFDDARLIACSEDHELAYIQPRSGG